MILPAEFASEFATFPEALRQLVEAELQTGNTIVAIVHGFPAAPCGASIKLAQPVKAERRKSVGGVKFYARNNPDYAGEFTTEPRHFFVLEPSLPPEPEPDIHALRATLEPKPDARAQFAQTPARGLAPKIIEELSPTSGPEPASAPKRALTCIETTTGATRLLHFRDHRPPHEIQFTLERKLMTLFAAAMKDDRLIMTAKAEVVGALYDLELRFEAAMLLGNYYSLRVETSWAKQAATHHDYFRRTAESWFSFWTRDFTPADPPASDADASARYEKICAASLNAEAHLDRVSALQQTIVAEMKSGASFATAHKEGGTRIDWQNGKFVRTDYGDYPDRKNFTSEEEFLKFLRQFYDAETSSNIYPKKASEFETWKLILRLLRRK